MNEALARTCLHEAGHAVMAKALGVICTGVRITSDHSGVCITSRADPNENLMISLAGIEAECLHFGFSRASEVACDLEHIAQHETAYGLSAIVIADTRLHVREVLKQWWPKVLRVAEQLARRRHLSSLQIDAYSFGTIGSMWRRSQRRPRRLRDEFRMAGQNEHPGAGRRTAP
jgi:hypothetical protein